MIFKDVQGQYKEWMTDNALQTDQVIEDIKNVNGDIRNTIEGLIGTAALTGNLGPSIFSALLTGFYFRDWLESEKKKEAQNKKECDILDVLWKLG